jgi:hypothetical protein
MRTQPADDANDIVPPAHHQLVDRGWTKRQQNLMRLSSIIERPGDCNADLMGRPPAKIAEGLTGKKKESTSFLEKKKQKTFDYVEPTGA